MAINQQKLLRYQFVRRLVDKKDEKGLPVPFRIKYACLNGEVIEGKNCVTTSVDVRKKTRNIMFLDSGQVRMLHDVLILEVNDTKIVVN